MSNENRKTPFAIAALMIDRLVGTFDFRNIMYVCDVGCGETGVWGRVAKIAFPRASIVGIDILHVNPPSFDFIYDVDFLCMPMEVKDRLACIDLWISNPPYSRSEAMLWQIYHLAHPKARIFMFLNASWLGGKERRKTVFSVMPPGHIFYLDGRIVDKTNPGESGTDLNGRVGLYWDLNEPKLNGFTTVTWVGSDKTDDYKV